MATIGDTTNTIPRVTHAESNGFIPGTTFPEESITNGTHLPKTEGKPVSFQGPRVRTRPTTVTLYEPAQLVGSPVLPSLYPMINAAFRESHAITRNMPDRLRHPEAFLQQIGADSGTFVCIMTWAGTNEAIATASAHRYTTPVAVAEGERGKVAMAFTRLKLPPARSEAERRDFWELKLMAVDLTVQGQGIASYLMNIVDKAVKHRFETTSEQLTEYGDKRLKLWMVLTTVKEINYEFYKRRGYTEDYETTHPPGSLGNEGGFSVVHMSKEVCV